MVVEWACLARVDERGKEWSQQARHAVAHSDPQICHRNPPLSPAPRPPSIATQYRDILPSELHRAYPRCPAERGEADANHSRVPTPPRRRWCALCLIKLCIYKQMTAFSWFWVYRAP